MNKVTVIIVSVLVFVVVFVGGIVLLFKDNGIVENEAKDSYIADIEKDVDSIKKKEMANFTKIDIDEYIELYKNDKSSVVLIGRSGCEYCQLVEPILRNMMYKDKFKINYLSLDGFDDAAREKLLKSDEYFEKKEGVETPMLLIVKDSSIVDFLEGVFSRKEYKKFFTNNDVISK